MFGLPRSSGVLLHPSSLPGELGMGELGVEANRFLDVLAEAGQSVWQVLPLGPTGYGNSPYQSPSTFAGNPLLIGLEALGEDGYLTKEELVSCPCGDPTKVDFGAVIPWRTGMLDQACDRFLAAEGNSEAFIAYLEKHHAWLDDYALYAALKSSFDGAPWTEWPEGVRKRQPEAIDAAKAQLITEIQREYAKQFLFDQQWSELRARAKEKGISLVGDIPIFVAHDSADVWAAGSLFRLDREGNPTVVAGVPPDYFSATGQRWGNPLYAWDAHAADGYRWWAERLRRVFEWVDIVRIDHFRGFAGFWEIPAEEPTAINGKWITGPGAALFEALRDQLGELPIIAEDLGIITPDVVELRDAFDFPGMRVMQFAFGGDTLAEDYVPENYPEHSVAYSGTHDNDTTLGLFAAEEGEGTTRTAEEIQAERRTILNYTGTDGSELHWDFIERVQRSKSAMVVFPMQDVLGLGSESRMNAPGIADGNWEWRFTWDQVDSAVKQRLLKTTSKTGRGKA